MISCHISELISSRTWRAFSRAVPMQAAIASRFARSTCDAVERVRPRRRGPRRRRRQALEQPAPMARRVARRAIERQIEIDVDEPRDVLGALEIAARPVQAVGDPRQHAHSAASFATVPPAARMLVQHPRVLAAAALRRVDDERSLAQRDARQPARHDRDASRRTGCTAADRRGAIRSRRRGSTAPPRAPASAGRCSCADRRGCGRGTRRARSACCAVRSACRSRPIRRPPSRRA